MHCGVMVTGYNQGDWERLLAEDYSRPPAVSDAANMDDTLELGELVEPLGFDSIWATEHYGSAYSMQPNPLQYLAYWAGRTRRVDVGTAVIVAPWWNPVRLASEISMLDILLKGRRLHLGIGRGISPHEYASLGYPIGESHAYFYDVIGALRASDGAERFTFDGKVYKIPPTTIRPQARHKGQLTAHQSGVHHRGLRADGRRERARADVRRRRGPRRDDGAGSAVQHDPGGDGAVRGEGPSRCAGHADPDQPGLSRRVSSDMVLTVSNSCTTLRLASTLSGASPDSGTSLRYFASTSAHSIPRGADPRGKST